MNQTTYSNDTTDVTKRAERTVAGLRRILENRRERESAILALRDYLGSKLDRGHYLSTCDKQWEMPCTFETMFAYQSSELDLSELGNIAGVRFVGDAQGRDVKYHLQLTSDLYWNKDARPRPNAVGVWNMSQPEEGVIVPLDMLVSVRDNGDSFEVRDGIIDHARFWGLDETPVYLMVPRINYDSKPAVNGFTSVRVRSLGLQLPGVRPDIPYDQKL